MHGGGDEQDAFEGAFLEDRPEIPRVLASIAGVGFGQDRILGHPEPLEKISHVLGAGTRGNPAGRDAARANHQRCLAFTIKIGPINNAVPGFTNFNGWTRWDAGDSAAAEN